MADREPRIGDSRQAQPDRPCKQTRGVPHEQVSGFPFFKAECPHCGRTTASSALGPTRCTSCLEPIVMTN